MGIRQWLSNTMTFVPPELQSDEWEDQRAIDKRRRLLESGELIEAETFGGVTECHWAPVRPIASRVLPRYVGFYAQRAIGTEQWSVVEVVADGTGELWWAWGPREPAVRVGDDRLGRFEWSNHPLVLPR